MLDPAPCMCLNKGMTPNATQTTTRYAIHTYGPSGKRYMTTITGPTTADLAEALLVDTRAAADRAANNARWVAYGVTEVEVTDLPEVEVLGTARVDDQLVIVLLLDDVTDELPADTWHETLAARFAPAMVTAVTIAMEDWMADLGLCPDHLDRQLCSDCVIHHGRETCHHADHEDYCPSEVAR